MKAGVREAFSLVLAEEPAVAEHDVVDFVSGTLAVQPVPLLRRLLALSVEKLKKRLF